MSGPIPRIGLVIAVMAASTGVLAQNQATPRPPLGPGDSSRQFPQGLQRQAPSVGADSITVSNLGGKPLRFSSWDGASSWKSFELAPGQTIAVTCAKCGDVIPIAFSDGSQNRTVDAKPANNYGLYWDESQSRWDLASIAEIMQRGLTR
jgi:hypothetical protein